MWGCSARRQAGATLPALSHVEGGPLVRLLLSVFAGTAYTSTSHICICIHICIYIYIHI